MVSSTKIGMNTIMIPQPHNFSKDYFDAMTDGSMGDYEDFGGNSDFIDDWSGR